MSKHLVIGDTQVRAGRNTDYLSWVGEYIVDKKPDVVVQIGDFADMPSLFEFETKKGRKSFEGLRYRTDIEAAIAGMSCMMKPLNDYNIKASYNHKPKYIPRLVLTLGNHEDRITRAVEIDPRLEGTLSLDHLGYENFGWEVIPYMQPVTIDGIVYSHFFPSGQMGRPCISARSILTKHHMSCIAGHQQGRDIAYGKRADGKLITAIIAGSYYPHDEDYLTPFTNKHWRGVYMLHEVKDGEFDEMAVSLNFLKRKYGK